MRTYRSTIDSFTLRWRRLSSVGDSLLVAASANVFATGYCRYPCACGKNFNEVYIAGARISSPPRTDNVPEVLAALRAANLLQLNLE